MDTFWRLVPLLVTTLISLTSTTDLCQIGLQVNSRTGTLCATPYCTCNDPYGRVYCSCKFHNETIPQISSITVRTEGACIVPAETQNLILSDCQNVTFTENSLASLRSLRTVQVTNVRETTLSKHAFKWNASGMGIAIHLTNTTVANFPSYALNGRIAKLVFRDVYLGLIHAFAFSSLTETERIQFVNCNFANIEPQSFKKFSTNEFLFENNRFNVIPSRFVHEVYVHKLFRLTSNFVNIAHTRAFQITHPTETIISNNHIIVLEGESISVLARGRVAIQDNRFENIEPVAFGAIEADRRPPDFPPHDYIPHDFIFDNNTLGTFSEASLLFRNADFHVRLSRFRFDETCTCDSLAKWRDLIFPQKKNSREPIEAHLTDIWCHEESTKEIDFVYIQGDTYYADHCTKLLSSIYFFVIIIVTTTVGLCILIMVCMCILRRRRQWDSVPTTDTNGVTAKDPKKKKGLVVPDGRVYRETEFHVIVEKAEPLEEVTPYRVTRDRSRTILPN